MRIRDKLLTNGLLIGATATVMWAPPAALGAELEEIIVTAQKREQSISDVGISISALSGDKFDRLRMDEAIDVSAHTAGLTAMNAVTNGIPIFAIRGMGLDDFYMNNNSSVAVFVDGIVASTPLFLHGQIYDVERVEVLKGPQGTLYGKNASGGVINFISRKPSSEPDAYVNLSYGNWQTVGLRGAVGGELTEGVRGRLAATFEDADNWQRDRDNGKEYGARRMVGIRAQLAWDVTDTLGATFAFRYSDEDAVPVSSQVEGTEVATDRVGGIIPGVLDLNGVPIRGLLDTGTKDPRVVRVGGLAVRKDDRGYGASMTWKLALENLDLESITGWDSHDHFSIDNIDGNPGPNFDVIGDAGAGAVGQEADASQFYQELRALFSWGRSEWTAGLMYATDRLEAVQPLDASMVSLAQRNPFERGVLISTSRYLQRNTSFGAYLNVDAALTDRTNLIGGLRYSDDRRGFKGTGTLSFRGAGSVITNQDETRNASNFTYRLTLQHKPMEKTLLFATVSTGYKNGVFYAGPPFSPASWAYVAPEKVFGFEVGAKAAFATASVTASVFDYRLDNRQGFLIFLTPPARLGAGLGSVPESTSRGAELEIGWRPLDRLSVDLGIAYLDAKVTKPPTDVRGFPLAAPIARGTRLALSPEWSVNAVAAYAHPIGGAMELRWQADYSYIGATTGALSDPVGVSGSRAALGARLELAPTEGGWSLALWGRNITNRFDDVRSVTDFFGGRQVMRQRPRAYGIEFSRQFY